jgi:hypothetical protein
LPLVPTEHIKGLSGCRSDARAAAMDVSSRACNYFLQDDALVWLEAG